MSDPLTAATLLATLWILHLQRGHYQGEALKRGQAAGDNVRSELERYSHAIRHGSPAEARVEAYHLVGFLNQEARRIRDREYVSAAAEDATNLLLEAIADLQLDWPTTLWQQMVTTRAEMLPHLIAFGKDNLVPVLGLQGAGRPARGRFALAGFGRNESVDVEVSEPCKAMAHRTPAFGVPLVVWPDMIATAPGARPH